VEHLVLAGYSPVVLTRSQPIESVTQLLGEGDLYIGDAADPDALEHALDGIDHVVFSAGGLLPVASELDPELDAQLTLDPVRATLDALRHRPGISLSYLSSGGTVYGEPDDIPVDEKHPTRPLGSYGKLHLVCEADIVRHCLDHGLQARILRCSSVYGERQRPDRGQGAVVTFIHRIERGEPLDLYGETTVRDYIYVGDVARVCVDLLGQDVRSPILNVASGEGTSLLELLRLIEKQVGRQAEFVLHPERQFDVRRIVLDTKQLRRLVNFDLTPLDAGISRTHRWLTTAMLETV
jgi:UDP-glucose 4-epimerase